MHNESVSEVINNVTVFYCSVVAHESYVTYNYVHSGCKTLIEDRTITYHGQWSILLQVYNCCLSRTIITVTPLLISLSYYTEHIISKLNDAATSTMCLCDLIGWPDGIFSLGLTALHNCNTSLALSSVEWVGLMDSMGLTQCLIIIRILHTCPVIYLFCTL